MDIIDKNVVVIGAGNIGLVIYQKLKHLFNDAKLVDKGNLLHKDIIPLDLTNENDQQELIKLLDKADYCVDAGPFFTSLKIANLCYTTDTHYLNLSEDVTTRNKIKKIYENSSGPVAIPGCGLAPGLVNIKAHSLANAFTEVHDIKMRVGALPQYATGNLKYSCSWSIPGLINEYSRDAEIIDDGKRKLVGALSGYETMVLEETEFEAFHTSGGAGTMVETWEGKCSNLNYKSLRWPGHLEEVIRIGNNQKDSKWGDSLAGQLMSMPYDVRDVVYMFISVSGVYVNGTKMVLKHMEDHLSLPGMTALQQVTTEACVVMLLAHVDGHVNQTGFVKQEDLDYVKYNEVFNKYGQDVMASWGQCRGDM